jgi:hypothetical protein
VTANRFQAAKYSRLGSGTCYPGGCIREISAMKKPRLIYYNDAQHFHGKRMEPKASIHMLQWPVDELAGTGIDTLVFGLGYGDVFFHQSKVGRVVGQNKEVWESYIDWRIMRMVEEAAKRGTDQVREVVNRGKELGIDVFSSLKMQSTHAPGAQRCGKLRWDHEEKVCIGEEGRNEWAYNYAVDLVREYKLAIVEEVLRDYEAEGIELDFMFGNQYFKQGEADAAGIMNGFMEDLRKLTREIGEKQNREIPVMVRICLERENNLAMGLDVEAWLADGSVDYVIGQDECVLSDTQPKPDWLPKAAKAAGGAAYYRPPRRVYDERVGLPSIDMTRALSQTLRLGGYSGLYHGYMRWPLDEIEYRFLREAGYPEVSARKPKRYLLQPREGDEGEPTTTPTRVLPAELAEGQCLRFPIWIADDVDGARKDKEMRKPILTLRFSFFCIEDDVEFRFNGRVLPWEDAEITDERALVMAIVLAGKNIQAPLGMSAHWFRYKLELDDVVQGENVIEVECRRHDKRAGFIRSLNGLEVLMRYRDMERPEGLGMQRLEATPG